jgi:hypothetical protein
MQCWMSDNTALRAIQLGYSRALWCPGGIGAWKHARLPLQFMRGMLVLQAPDKVPVLAAR